MFSVERDAIPPLIIARGGIVNPPYDGATREHRVMEAVEFEQDDMLRLLTDALRRGPGSPEWRDALQRLSANPSPDLDEYKLLLQARENIEMGKSYREVRAGPGFTRDLMQKLDAEASITQPMKFAPIVAAISGLLILLAILWIGVKIASGPGSTGRQELTERLFVNVVHQYKFDDAQPDDLKSIGAVKLEAKNGLHIADTGKELAATAVCTTSPVDISKGICVETRAIVTPDVSGQRLQVFISDEQPTGDPHRELAVMIDGQNARLLSETSVSTSPVNFSGTANIRIRVNSTAAIVECNGQPIFSGSHNLDAAKPKYIGLRFVREGTQTGRLSVPQLTILKP